MHGGMDVWKVYGMLPLPVYEYVMTFFCFSICTGGKVNGSSLLTAFERCSHA